MQPDSAMTLRLHIADHWRGTGDGGRYCMSARGLTILCLIAWLALGFGCSPSGVLSTTPPTDTSQANQARVQLGIRPIKSDWIFCGREFQAEKWKDGTNLCKMVQRDNSGALLWEQDYYYSGLSYPTSKGTDWEFLAVNYDYTTRQASVDYVGTNAAIAALVQNLTLVPLGPKDQSGQRTQSHAGSSNEETFHVADKVLAMWNRTRL
jgi:hypothetical protein